MSYPFMDYPINYAQVVNNHYYFLWADGKGNYTIYRDKGKVEGRFLLKEGIVEAFDFLKKFLCYSRRKIWKNSWVTTG